MLQLFSVISFCVAAIAVTAQAIEQNIGFSPEEQVRKAICLHLMHILANPDSYEEEDWSGLTVDKENHYGIIHEYTVILPSGATMRKIDYFVLDENFQVIDQIDISCVKRFTWRRALRAIKDLVSGSENQKHHDYRYSSTSTINF